jgi:multidrug efflux pump subunit AcrA (membrane-fusion protein)
VPRAQPASGSGPLARYIADPALATRPGLARSLQEDTLPQGLAPPGALAAPRHPPSAAADDTERADRRRRHMTWPQLAGGLLLAAACVAATVWYVPHIVASDEHSLTGTVTSTGVLDLNFAQSGQLAAIDVHLGQQVTRGETLASESHPATGSLIKADKAAISADNAKLAELRAQPGPGQPAAIAAGKAQLAKDEATLDSDEAGLVGTKIVATQPGTVVAVNGQPGELVSSLGVRDYASDSGATSIGQEPQFSLLPEGPQTSLKLTGAESELPVVALRVSDNWDVAAIVPENSISAVHAGQEVMISVPSAHISGVRGVIQEVVPTPESTSQGVAYQAVVEVLGHHARAPLSGMAANVELQR